jgi:hypothetical protein
MRTDRRDFLRTGAFGLAASLIAACDSTGPAKADALLKLATNTNERLERALFRHTSMDHAPSRALAAGDRFP